MQFTKMVEVDDARVEALTPEAFRLVLEARGWTPAEREHWQEPGQGRRAWWHVNSALLRPLADLHHNGATFDAFTEVERVQALLHLLAGETTRAVREHIVTRDDTRLLRMPGARRGPLSLSRDKGKLHNALPRLVRIVCGVEAA